MGAYRTAYANGDVIDATATLPSGESFGSLRELSAILAADPRFISCTAEKMWAYGLGRGERSDPDGASYDIAYLQQIVDTWASSGGTLNALMKAIVINDTFRFRRGEAPGAVAAVPAPAAGAAP